MHAGDSLRMLGESSLLFFFVYVYGTLNKASGGDASVCNFISGEADLGKYQVMPLRMSSNDQAPEDR
jgi:hypothetical protein